MVAYSQPTGAVIRGYTRLQGQAFEQTDTELEAALLARVADGEDAVFSRVGVSYETDSSLTDRQVRHLQRAVSFRTALVFLFELEVDHAGGTHAALLSDPEVLARVIERFEAQALEQEGLLEGSGQAVDTRPFALPAVSASTFTVSTSDRLPSERNELLDESDDISASDTENG